MARKVVFGIAVQPHRFDNLKYILPRLLEQGDKLFIHINGCKKISDSDIGLIDNRKVSISSSEANLGAEMKFTGMPETKGYFFPVDDDVLYPFDYAENMIKICEYLDNKIVSCVHGSSFDLNETTHIFNKRIVYHFQRKLSHHLQVLIPATNSCCIPTKLIQVIPESFKVSNMVDPQLAGMLARKRIPVIAIKREENWLQQLPMGGTSIWRENSTSQERLRLYDQVISQYKEDFQAMIKFFPDAL